MVIGVGCDIQWWMSCRPIWTLRVSIWLFMVFEVSFLVFSTLLQHLSTWFIFPLNFVWVTELTLIFTCVLSCHIFSPPSPHVCSLAPPTNTLLCSLLTPLSLAHATHRRTEETLTHTQQLYRHVGLRDRRSYWGPCPCHMCKHQGRPGQMVSVCTDGCGFLCFCPPLPPGPTSPGCPSMASNSLDGHGKSAVLLVLFT